MLLSEQELHQTPPTVGNSALSSAQILSPTPQHPLWSLHTGHLYTGLAAVLVLESSSTCLPSSFSQNSLGTTPAAPQTCSGSKGKLRGTKMNRSGLFTCFSPKLLFPAPLLLFAPPWAVPHSGVPSYYSHTQGKQPGVGDKSSIGWGHLLAITWPCSSLFVTPLTALPELWEMNQTEKLQGPSGCTPTLAKAQSGDMKVFRPGSPLVTAIVQGPHSVPH